MQNIPILKKLKDEGIDVIKDVRFAPATDIVLGALAAFAPALPLLSFAAAGSLCLRGLLQLFVSKTDAYTNNLNEKILGNMDEFLNDASFVEKLRMSYTSAVNSHSDEKAALFANLLNGAFDKNISTDLFFELNQLLCNLSVRQMELLADLKKRPDREEQLEFRDWVDGMLEKYNCDEDELDSEYLRLQGLGMCESAHEFGEFGNPDYRHFNYYPTPMLDKLIRYILSE